MKSVEKEKQYRSFLLRLWKDELNGKRNWRISLENPFTRERRGFATLEDLIKYLEILIQENENPEV
jgi:hypothetical protein